MTSEIGPPPLQHLVTQASTSPIRQVAWVVRDLERAVRNYADLLGIGPWTAYDLTPEILQDGRYYGSPAQFGLRHALGWKGEVQFELVQPTSGPSIFSDHLSEHGEGLHHVGIYVDDHDAAVQEVLAQGFDPIQSARGFGANGDGAFAYFLSPDLAGCVVELIKAPSVRRQPLFVFPPDHTSEEQQS